VLTACCRRAIISASVGCACAWRAFGAQPASRGFLPAGAEAYRRDIPGADVRFFDTGHFALETHCAEIATAIRDFIGRTAAAAA
jgi:pimeloyl-ACP methyl ester carboxylesterase